MSWREHASPRRTRAPQVRGALARPRLLQLLRDARPVLLLNAPGGYGKTTALAAHLAELGEVCWYTLDADDADLNTFAGGLALAVARLPGGSVAETLMDAAAAPRVVIERALDVLVERDALLVLDEAQHLTPSAAHELLSGPRLALLSRTRLDLPDLTSLEVRGEVQRLGAAELAFDVTETEALLRAHGVPVQRGTARHAHAMTEGWPIAARFLAQALASGRLSLEALHDLEAQATELSSLFAYLAQEILDPLGPELRDFLTQSSVFEVLTPDLLASVLEEPLAASHLESLATGGTFLTREGSAYRAHPLLRAHLRGQLPEHQARQLAARGAEYFEYRGLARPALQAHLQAGNMERAGQLLVTHGARWLEQGRLSMLERSLERLGAAAFEAQPELFALLGDVRRLQSRYPQALAAYERAPERLAVLGQVRVYLDTVQPAPARELLQRAEQLDIAGYDQLPRLHAENALNAGHLDEAVGHWPEIAQGVRFALRSGNLSRALALAQDGARGEVGGQRAAQNHREALLLVSLLCTLMGELTDAEASARAGLQEGERLESPFVQSLAFARLGHVQIARGQWDAARSSYESALSTAEGTATRLTVEPLMGLSFLDAATSVGAHHARQALSISESSGDRYMVALLRLTYALGLAHAHSGDAPAELLRAREDFLAVGDAFGLASTELALYAARAGDARRALAALSRYPFLLERPSLFAPARSRAGRAAVLARLAQDLPEHRAELRHTAQLLGYAELPERHPGVEVEVRLLGRLGLTRGGVEVREWGRAKARELLALLALHQQGVSRESAQEALYPDTEPGVGERNFRIVLHALGQLLEPEGASGYFLERGEWLRLRPSPDLRVDLHEAWRAFNASPGTPGRAQTLLDVPAELANLELTAFEAEAERYAARLPEALAEEAAAALAHGQVELAVRLAERALSVEAAHEPAARVLMRAHHARGHLNGVARAYARCCAALATLDLTPLPETDALYRTLRG